MTRKLRITGLATLGLAFLVACAEPPAPEIDAARQAVSDASASESDEYAPEALRAAMDAQAQLDAELKAQEEKFSMFRSYDRTKELAAEVKRAGEKAASEAAANKQRARQEASDMLARLETGITEVKALLDEAPTGKGTAADIAALKGDVTSVEQSLTDVRDSIAREDFKGAKARAEAAQQSIDQVRADVSAAIETAKLAKSKRRG
jgi:hypothetical protein